MAKVGVDIDGVLARFDQGFAKFANAYYGMEKIPADYVPIDWHWSNVLKPEEEAELWREFRKLNNFWMTLDEFPALQELCRFVALNQNEHDVWFVTARALCSGSTITEQTQRWLEAHMGPFFECTRGVVTVTKSDKKKQVIEGMGISYMIDDHGETIVELDSVPGLNAYLLDRPWNQHVTVKNRVSDFSQYLKAIEEGTSQH